MPGGGGKKDDGGGRVEWGPRKSLPLGPTDKTFGVSPWGKERGGLTQELTGKKLKGKKSFGRKKNKKPGGGGRGRLGRNERGKVVEKKLG